MFRVDLSWVLSSAERDLLIQEFGVESHRLALSKFAYPNRESGDLTEQSIQASYPSRRGFVMVGNFRHAPNLDGFRWLCDDIWPRLRERLPAAEVHIYGAYPPREVMACHSPKRVF